MTCDPAESAEMSRFWTLEQDCSVGMEEAPDDTNYYKKFTRTCPDSTTNNPNAGTKGQINSEWIYEIINFPKNDLKNLKDFCPLYYKNS